MRYTLFLFVLLALPGQAWCLETKTATVDRLHTTPTSAKPPARACASPKPSQAKG